MFEPISHQFILDLILYLVMLCYVSSFTVNQFVSALGYGALVLRGLQWHVLVLR